jgi:hypothetical protein
MTLVTITSAAKYVFLELHINMSVDVIEGII